MALFSLKKDNIRTGEPTVYIEEIPIELIHPNPNQPRKVFDEEKLMELAASIKEVGLIQPLVVRFMGGEYELISGERRLRAAGLLNMRTVRCIVTGNVNENDSALMAVIENLQREDLNFFEEAECYAQLIKKLGITQDVLADRLGKSQSFIANKLRLLKIEPELRSIILDARLSERHARSLLRLGDGEQRYTAAAAIISKSLSVKETERYIDGMLNKNAASGDKNKPKQRIIRIFRDYKLFINTVNTACEQLRESGLKVNVEQSDKENGVEILIKVTQ